MRAVLPGGAPHMKQLEVQILGQSYLLGCPEGGEARMLDAVTRVDAAMCAIRDAGRIKARDRIAVLAALNLAFEQSETPLPATDGSAQNSQAIEARLSSLLTQLDAALGDDGRLL